MRESAAALVLAAAAGLSPSQAQGPSATTSSSSQCHADEEVVYSCRFGRNVGSVCLGTGTVHYRFGPPGDPEIEIDSSPDWSNIHVDSLYGGGLIQQHVRFTSGDYHYIVHFGETGRYADHPGRPVSGIAILRGPEGREEIASLDCEGSAEVLPGAYLRIGDQAPQSSRDDLLEPEDGPFNGYY